MARPTRDEMPALGASAEEIRDHLQRVSDQVRGFGLGRQADHLDRIRDAMQRPTLDGIFAEISGDKTWVTRELALWMAEQLMEAASIITELMEDAEITGSSAPIERGRRWLAAMGMVITD